MPKQTLSQRVDQLEELVSQMRDPIALAASKDDHTLAKRILQLESDHSNLNHALVTTTEQHSATQKLIIQHDATLTDLESRVEALERHAARDTTPIELPHA